MKRILFVDDEQSVLDGLKDVLRKQRRCWDMVFALGGDNAIAELKRGAFDVVLSDVRMQGMDGVTLLQQIKELHPATVRIILSGHPEQATVVNALPVAHQFLCKPCDVHDLRNVVERACAVQALLQNPNIRRIIGMMNRLPSAPQTYFALTHAAAQPDFALAELADIVQQDPAMAVKVLQLVSSSYFCRAPRQASLHHAVMFIGADLLKVLALTAHVFSSDPAPSVKGFSVESLQGHSLLTAQVASSFFADKYRAAEVFTAAMVQDIGKMVFAMGMPVQFAEVIAECNASGRADHEVERELLGATHAEVGAYLLSLWGLPLAIVEAVAYHHDLDNAPRRDTLVALHVATSLCTTHSNFDLSVKSGEALNVNFVESMGFGAELPRWRGLAEEIFRSCEVRK